MIWNENVVIVVHSFETASFSSASAFFVSLIFWARVLSFELVSLDET